MIFTSLSPNTQKDDIFLAFKLLFLPWKWKKGKASEILEQKFKDYFGMKYAHSVNNGRTALFSILSALGVEDEGEVLIQSYTCVAVPEPILWANLKPVYVDCDKETLGMDPSDLEKKITPKSKVLIIQHTLGFAAKVDELLEIASKHNLIVIEDCAHALGAEYKGKKVGTIGDVGFFSFGRDKVLSSVFGGIIVTNDKSLGEKIEKIRNAYRYPGFIWIKRQLLHPLILSVSKALYNFLYLGKIFIFVSRKLRLISVAVEKTELSGGRPSFAFKRMPNALALLALNQFKKLDKYNDHRREIASIYREELKGTDVRVIEDSQNSKNIYLRFPIFIKNPKALIQYAKSKGIELGNWYTEAIAPKGVNFWSVGYQTCDVSERLANESVNLPTGIQIRRNDALKVSKVVKEFLSASAD